ncbi:MAG: folate-binding protein [Pseudomonadota bacterium]|nr:folate-binding protein [Pseudomonadota bacterium]
MNPSNNIVEIGRLSVTCYLRASGADAESFLQGQLSSDLRLLRESKAQISSYNSPKGRMLALPHLIRRGGDILIELHPSVAAATLKRLRMFVLRAKVALEDTSASMQALAIIGTGAAELLQKHGLPAPTGALESAFDAERQITVVRRIGTLPRYSLTGEPDQLARLPFDTTESMDEAWRRADIEAGVATVSTDTSDHFVPQMANLDLLGGISFDKGCYTGQEIVARLHYLGQLKRRMFIARIAGPAPAPGSEVRIADHEGAVGEIVDAVVDGTGSVASVVLQLAYAERNDLQLVDGAAVVIAGRPVESAA